MDVNMLTKFVLLSVLINLVLSKSVSIFDKNIGQLVTSSLLTWEPYSPHNLRQLEHAVAAGTFLIDQSPAYICRSTMHSIAVTGYVKKHDDNSRECIISQHSQLSKKKDFDVLINRGNGAKVEWQLWDRSRTVFQQISGTVSTINGGGSRQMDAYYIARHKNNHSLEHHQIDHAIGWFDPSEGFGKIHATVANSEHTFDIGEILTTFEPIKYELHDIKFKSIKLKESKNRTLLGQTILKNEGDQPIEVNAVIGYHFRMLSNLGHHDAIARGVNTTVYKEKKEVYSFLWGIQEDQLLQQTKGIGTVLEPGTALNVTLWGNYTTREGPYDAYLYITYSDGSRSKRSRITVNNALEANMEEQLEIEYSPTFWLHNNTIVPTTTQRTTVSSSTSTTNKSIFSTSMSSNAIEKITEKSSIKNGISIDDEYDEEENEVDRTNGSSKIHMSACILILSVVHLIHQHFVH